MGRNFAQIAILLFGFFLLYDGNKKIRALFLDGKLTPEETARLERGTGNRFLFLTVKTHLPKPVYEWNLYAFLLFFFCTFWQLTLGWFSWFGGVVTVFNVITILFLGFGRYYLSVLESRELFGKSFVFLRKNPLDDGNYLSGLIDGFLYLILPLAATVLNFSLL